MESVVDGVAAYLGRVMKSDDSWERKLENDCSSSREKMLLMASSEDITVPSAVID